MSGPENTESPRRPGWPVRIRREVKPMNRHLILLLGAMVIVGAGCTMAPEYTRPEAPIPASWPSGDAYKDTSATSGAPLAAEVPWREFFTDERLQKIIETALNNNRDLKTAALNVERA